jgi:hypothetical protein
MRQLFFSIYFLLSLTSLSASDFPFQAGEKLTFDINYKYGLVMVKAGTANYTIESSNYQNKNSYKSTLDFKTSSFFDRMFKMRDTLTSRITENLRPLYYKHSVHEGNYQFTEELFFLKSGPEYSEVHAKKESDQIIRIDTILTLNTETYDILNLFLYIRSFDFAQWQATPERHVSTIIGKDKVNITIRCEGQSVVERSDTLKYKTYKIAFDFTDKAFNESKNAIEVWLSDDKNRIPIKIRAKLRIGAAEVYLTSRENLKYPLSSEIIIPAQ